jgi:hypothetical protein
LSGALCFESIVDMEAESKRLFPIPKQMLATFKQIPELIRIGTRVD